MGDVPTIAFINESTVADDVTVSQIVNAIHKQVWRDFVPAWGIKKAANCMFVAKGQNVPAGAWQMIILDTSDQAGALGYHETTSTGQPLGKVFAKSDQQYGSSLSVTISHETLEMLADPEIDQTYTRVVSPQETDIYALEDCDAVEDDSLGYIINGILLSDFVFPSWFSDPGNQQAGTQYDFMSKCSEPLQLLSGGYIGIQKVINGQSQGWTQITDKLWKGAPKPAHLVIPGSRRDRRKIVKASRRMSKISKHVSRVVHS